MLHANARRLGVSASFDPDRFEIHVEFQNAGCRARTAPIVCFANNWRGDPTSKHHVMRYMARSHPVTWVESSGMRVPRLTSAGDLRRILGKLRSASAPAALDSGVRVVSPLAIPIPSSRVARSLNRRLYRKAVARVQPNDELPLLWVYMPTVAPYLDACRGAVWSTTAWTGGGPSRSMTGT